MRIKDVKSILVFSAHHDDEVIGCGGTIKKMTENNVEVHVVFATDGSTGIDHTRKYESKIKSERIEESKKVASLLGITSTTDWKEKCQNLKYSSELMQRAVHSIRTVQPDIIITHSAFEKHRDHQELSKIVTQAAWKASEDILPNLGPAYRVPNVWAYEVVDILPRVDISVDITEYFDKKIEAMNIYESQHNVVSGINKFMEGLSMVRGYDIGKRRAEAFMSIAIQPKEVLKT